MSLQKKMNALNEKLLLDIPKEAVAIMHRATEELKNSNIMDTILRPGDKVPEFFLKNAEGNTISSKSLLEKGKLIINFYRGKW
jgi:hypothetical protein